MPPIIISLTSYPARINTVSTTIISLLAQKAHFDRLILWLAKSEFPNQETDLPQDLTKLIKYGLTIKWCENIKSYKKLIPALKEFPNSIIITADDDVIYPKDWLNRLFDSYQKDPSCIHCLRAHRICFSHNQIEPYRYWDQSISSNRASSLLFPTGVGGVLYPPNSLHEDVLKPELFTTLCPDTDDIWFWTMATLKGTKFRVASPTLTRPKYVPGSQDGNIPLYKKNKSTGNDYAIKNILHQYPNIKHYLHQEINLKYYLSRIFDFVSNNEETRIRICSLPLIRILKDRKYKIYIFGLRIL